MACTTSCPHQDCPSYACGECGEPVPGCGWYYRKSGPKAGERLAPCKECGKSDARAAHRRKQRSSPEYREKRRERMRLDRVADPRKYRDRRLVHDYNIDLACYESMLAAQGGGCAICGSTTPAGKGEFHVDHNRACCPTRRSCGACVRGLLCARCNVGIAMFNDRTDDLNGAIKYITSRA